MSRAAAPCPLTLPQLLGGAVLGMVFACLASIDLAPVDPHQVFSLAWHADGAVYIALEVLCSLPGRDACLLPCVLGMLLARPCYRVMLAPAGPQRLRTRAARGTWIVPALFATAMVFGRSFDGAGSAAGVASGISQAISGVLCGIGWLGIARVGIVYLFDVLDRAGASVPLGALGPGDGRATASARPADETRTPKASDSSSEGCIPRRAWRGLVRWAKRHLVAAPALVLAIAWLPCLIGYAPGLFMWDTNTQILQWFGLPNHISASMGLSPETAATMITRHHPPLHTAAVGLCVQAGIALAGSENAGIMIYALLQYTLVVASFGYALATLERLGVPRRVRVAILVFLAVVPVFSGYAVLITKDVPFAAMLLVMLSALVRELHGVSRSVDRVLLAASGLAASQLRSAALYIVAVPLACALAALVRLGAKRVKDAGAGVDARTPVPRRGARRAVAAALVLVVGVAILLEAAIFPALGMLPASKREMLSIPVQQVARYLREHPDGLSAEEYAAVDVVLDAGSIAALYNPSKSDPVKATYREGATPEELSRFFKVWLAIVARDPACAATATAANYYGYFYPGQAVSWSYTSDLSREAMANTETDRIKSDIASYFSFSQLDNPITHGLDALVSAYRTIWQRLPGLTYVMQAAFWCWLLVIATAYALHDRRRLRQGERRARASLGGPSLAPALLIPLWLILLMALVGPCNATTYFRYVYPLAVCLPFVCALLVFAPRGPARGIDAACSRARAQGQSPRGALAGDAGGGEAGRGVHDARDASPERGSDSAAVGQRARNGASGRAEIISTPEVSGSTREGR